MYMDASILPSELIATPQPLIGFCGLDVNSNAVHKTIWDAFSNNRKVDRVAVQFKLLPSNYDFPVLKPKRQSYEWYHPRGILKRNWMLKHLHVLPSVVVLFQDIEWNDTQWTEKQLQCASLVQSLKNSLQGRNTRIAVVLLQKISQLPAHEDSLALERAANITNKCDISAKMLFVLPYNDHLIGYTIRLESAFLELAQSYYAQMARQVRLHRDQLTDSHQNLKIRHLFKLGFISEMRMDFSNALKHYSLAYSTLEDIRIVDTNCLEIKVIAGFLNYKIGKLMFKSNLPKDSITQFKIHIDKYKHRIGFKELSFEHYAWLSVQHNAFAELFCEAIKNGLAASQTQHPGIYYQKAAEYITKRKEAYLECCALSLSPTETIPPAPSGLLYSDFFGVRGAKTTEPITEQQIISQVQENEKTYNHSSAIITLMGLAMAQFKANKCLRFRKKLAIDMADEYLKSGDHSKALTLYSLMLPDYRVDKWYNIFTEVLMKTLRSAYLAASVADFITCSIESISSQINIPLTERKVILENLWKVFQMIPPVSLSQITPELKQMWEHMLNNFKTPIVIDLDRICSLFESKITFAKPQVKYDNVIHTYVYLRLITDVPFKIKNISIILNETSSKNSYKFSSKHYKQILDKLTVVQDDGGDDSTGEKLEIGENLLMEPRKLYKFYFNCEKYQFMENIELNIVKLEIEMGSSQQYVILTQNTTVNQTKLFKTHNESNDLMESIVINPLCYIIPTFHLATQINQTSQPMLVNEYFKVVTNFSNAYNVCLQNVGICISVPPNLRNKVFLATDLTPTTQKLLSHIQIDIGELQSESATDVIYYITSLIDGNIELQQKIWYQTENLNLINQPQSSPISNNSPNHESPPPTKLLSKRKSQMSTTVGGSSSTNNSINNNINNNHNIKIEYINDSIKKIKDDIIIISCCDELQLAGKFFTLSHQALMRAYKNEDFILKINSEIKSKNSNIQILETKFLCDYNIKRKHYSGEKSNFLTKKLQHGDKIEEILILSSNSITSEWITKENYNKNKFNLIFNNNNNNDNSNSNKNKISNQMNNSSDNMMTTELNTSQVYDTNYDPSSSLMFNKNLLSKLPTNSTIIGTTLSQSQMYNLNIAIQSDPQQIHQQQRLIISDDNNLMTITTGGSAPGSNQMINSSLINNISMGGGGGNVADTISSVNRVKCIYNSSSDAIEFVQADDEIGRDDNENEYVDGYSKEDRGFFKSNFLTINNSQANDALANLPMFGVYCVKWKRADAKDVNESKFIINGIEIIEPVLNLYCYFDEKMYVRTPMTLKIVIKNPTSKILHLHASLNNSDSFMFAGHKQVNISLFSHSKYVLSYNLYPLKLGWQQLPELLLEYNTQYDPEKKDELQQIELNNLVKRWMPKFVFIHPLTKSTIK